MDYFDFKIKQDNINSYLTLIKEAKNAVSIPVIASINCVSSHEWTYFAKKIEDADADALELNVFIAPTDSSKSSEEKEKIYFDIINEVTSKVNIPVIVKMSYYFTDLSGMINKLSKTNIKGLVLFNRFFSPDIDINKLEIIPSYVFSTPSDLSISLRWIAIMAKKVGCDLAASTGVYDGEAVIKQILAGADAVQVVSCLYKNGVEYLEKLLERLESWMTAGDYKSLTDFKGKLSQAKSADPSIYDRVQFMRYYGGKKNLKI